MDLKIRVCTDDMCKVIIQDITGETDSGYLPESSSVIVKGRYKYSETCALDVLVHKKVSEDKVMEPKFSLRNNKTQDTTIDVNFDGWLKVCHIVLPTTDWYQKQIESGGASLLVYGLVYFTDGKNIFKLLNGNPVLASIEEVIEVNPDNTTISKVEKDYVAICNLKKCYINACKAIFNNRGFNKCWNRSKVEQELIFKRDLLWMAINVIKYMVSFNQLAEAERIIEQIISCNGLCPEFGDKSDVKKQGCGCGNKF